MVFSLGNVMRAYLLFFIGFLMSLPLSAQVLKGRVTDQKGVPVPFATIYFREISLGLVADDHGDFQTTLKEGSYTCECSSLGYEKKIMPVTISGKNTTLKIELQEKAYSLSEVIVNTNGEDPAYAIMRKAIAKAPFHLHQVKSYQANVYIKGSVKVEKIPAVMKLSKENREFAKNFANKLYLMESQNEVTFTDPDRYDQKVLAISSTIPAEIDEGMVIKAINSSIYSPDMYGISPLAPKAFSYYKYVYEGFSMEGDHTVNKIKVISKKNNGLLFNGWIYIVEDDWNVQHVDLTISMSGVTFHINTSYNEVRPTVFLPTTYDMDVKMDIFGLKGGGKYYSSVQYQQVEVYGSSSPVTADSQPDKATAKPVATAKKPAVKKQPKKQLEITPRDSLFRVTRDTMALLRDSIYWLEVRNMPLQPEEVISYLNKDSLKAVNDSISKTDSLQNRTLSKWLSHLALGEEIRFGEKYTFKYDGIAGACPEYNFTDGFWLGQKFRFGVNFTENKSFNISPSVYYLTARKDVNWQVKSNFNYAPMRLGKLSVSAGDMTADFAGDKGLNRTINSVASLIFAENVAKFYRKQFVTVSHQIELAHALQLTTGINYEKRSALENNTSYSLFGGRPASNLPYGQIAPMPGHSSLTAGIQLSYTPRYYYRIRKGRKQYDHSDFPHFMLAYNRTVPEGEKEKTSFDKI
ncbi:MAG: DUF5686 and carboxypeptidase regulatory-like domain-containing protein, partial [Tannerella sp.]|nr:DUF5686 and carboxypeptidase regulatory-like domain-containing protein [Tannerella sp.]